MHYFRIFLFPTSLVVLKVTPLSQCIWEYFKSENISNFTWTDFKMASCLLEAWWWFLDSRPNLTETYPCRAKNEKEICYRIFDCREMGVKVVNVTMTWTTGEGEDPSRPGRSWFCGTNLQNPRLIRQKIMVYCKLIYKLPRPLAMPINFWMSAVLWQRWVVTWCLRTHIGLRLYMVKVYIKERINDQTTICAGGSPISPCI